MPDDQSETLVASLPNCCSDAAARRLRLRVALVGSRRRCLQRWCSPARVYLLARGVLRRSTWRGLVLQSKIFLLLLRGVVCVSPLSEISWKQCQAGNVRNNDQSDPDPQNPACPARRSPRPQLEAGCRVPHGQPRDSKSDDDMDNPRRVKALCLVADKSQKHLKEHDDKDGKTSLTMRAREVGAVGLRSLHHNHDKSDQHKHKCRDGDGTVDGEPLEEGSAVASNQNGCGHEEEPCCDHEHQMNDDELVAPAQNPSRLVRRRGAWCYGRRSAIVGAGR